MVPAPGGLPVVGHLAAFHRDRLGFLDACRATGGPVVRLRFARPTYLLLEPEDIGHVLVSYGAYAKTDRLTDGRGQRAVGGGVLVAREGDHRDQRRTVRHVLSARRLERFGERVLAHTDRAIDGWPDGDAVDVSRAMVGLARDVMLDVVFGAEDAEGRATIFAGIAERRRSLDRSAHSPFRFPGRLPLALRPRRRRAIEGLDDAIEARLDDGPDSVLTDLASANDSSAAGARDEAVSLGVAGYETVGQGLAWCLLAVAEAPEVMRTASRGGRPARRSAAGGLRPRPAADTRQRASRRRCDCAHRAGSSSVTCSARTRSRAGLVSRRARASTPRSG